MCKNNIHERILFRQARILFSTFLNNIVNVIFLRLQKDVAIADPENVSPRCARGEGGGDVARSSTPVAYVGALSLFHPFRSTPAPLFLVGWLGKRDATHLLPNYFAHGSVKNFPRCHYCSVVRENLVICSFHCFTSRPVRKICCHLVSTASRQR